MAANFPSGLPTTATLRGNLVDNLATLITSALGAADTTITVDDTTAFPSTGLLSIKKANGTGIIEVVSYTGKTATTFTGVTRDFNGLGNQAYSIDDEVNQYWVADHHNRHVEETIAIATNISDRFGLGTNISIPNTIGKELIGTTVLKASASGTNTLLQYKDSSNNVLWSTRLNDSTGELAFVAGSAYSFTAESNVASLSTMLLTNLNASGSAQLRVYTGGGDTSLSFYNGTTFWSIGLDDSDSDSLVVTGAATLNGTNLLRLTTSGNMLIAGSLTLPLTSNQIVLGTTNTVTITSPAPAASRVYTIPDAGGAASFVLTGGAQTINGSLTLAAAAGNPIHGTNTNDSAAAGYVGEYVSSAVGNVNATTTAQYGDATSISLTAGDWLVMGGGNWSNNGATWTAAELGISTTSGNSATGLVFGQNALNGLWASSSTTPLTVNFSIPPFRIPLAATTTVYLKYKANYSAGLPRLEGAALWAVRIR